MNNYCLSVLPASGPSVRAAARRMQDVCMIGGKWGWEMRERGTPHSGVILLVSTQVSCPIHPRNIFAGDRENVILLTSF